MTTKHTLELSPDRPAVPFDEAVTRYVVLRIQAPEATSEAARPAVSIAFVIDRSGSMAGEKLKLAVAAVCDALGRLREDDRAAVVTYDHECEILQPATACTGSLRAAIRRRLARLEPGGTTDLGAGWLSGCVEISEGASDDRLARCLLLTDGRANRGITDPSELRHHAAQLRRRGVSTSTFGVGADFDEALLGTMADAGGGSFYYLENAARIPAVFTDELGDALEVVCRDVRISITGSPGLATTVVGPWTVVDGGVLDLPDLVSAQELTVVLRLRIPAGSEPVAKVRFDVTDRDGRLGEASAEVAFERAGASALTRQPRDVAVDRLVAEAYAGLAREQASLQNRDGSYEAARDTLRRVARRIAGYAGGDPELVSLVAQLKAEADRLAAPMSAAQSKAMYYASHTALRSRSLAGKKTRWTP